MISVTRARSLFLFFMASCLMFGLFLPISSSAAPGERYFEAEKLGNAYYSQMKTEIADMVRLTVKGSNVRVRNGAGTSFEIDHEAQRGDIFYAKKKPIKGTDGLWWYEIVGALYSQEETVAEKLENKFICADFVKAGPLTKETKNYYGDVGFIKRHIYKIFTDAAIEFTLDRDTPFLPDSECPIVTDTEKNVLPSGAKLYYGYSVISYDGYLEFFAVVALPERHSMKVGRVRLEDYARINFGSNEKRIRGFINEAVRLNKSRIKNKLP